MSSGRNMRKRKTKRKHIPNCLRRYRKARGLKQKDVAEILGVKSASMISRWENGLCLPSAMNLFRLASLYRRMTDALFIDLLREMREDFRKREERILTKSKAAKWPIEKQETRNRDI
jgi:transcriptional regulator with XRE-family HTH domain